MSLYKPGDIVRLKGNSNIQLVVEEVDCVKCACFDGWWETFKEDHLEIIEPIGSKKIKGDNIMEEIKVGDVVTLKGSNSLVSMVVENVKDNTCECIWLDGNQIVREFISLNALKIYSRKIEDPTEKIEAGDIVELRGYPPYPEYLTKSVMVVENVKDNTCECIWLDGRRIVREFISLNALKLAV